LIRPDELQDIEVVAEDAQEGESSFLRIRRLRLRHRYRGGAFSTTYPFDVLEVPFLDAVVVVLYYRDSAGRVRVGLRRGVRPSIYLRRNNPAKVALGGAPRLTYLELIAGGIEAGDLGGIGIDGRAALEVREEAGFEVSADEMVRLGEGTFSSPAFGMEKLHYRAVEVDPDAGREPEGDGHPLEEVGGIEFYELAEAISRCRCGTIQDSKTEIGLYRLANYLGYHPDVGLWRYELPETVRRRVQTLGLRGAGEKEPRGPEENDGGSGDCCPDPGG
jgi:ADP-ribose pyrophosphatase